MFRRAVQAVVILVAVWGVLFMTGRTREDVWTWSTGVVGAIWTQAQVEWRRVDAWLGRSTPEGVVSDASRRINSVECVRDLLPVGASGVVAQGEETARRGAQQLVYETTGRTVNMGDGCVLRR